MDLAERDVLVLESVVMGALQLGDQVCGGGCRHDLRPHRQRIDEQPHHRFRAEHLGGPSRDHCAEGDIMLAGQPHQQLRVGALQHDVYGGVEGAGQLAKRLREILGHPKRFDDTGPLPQPIRRSHQGRGVKAGQHLTPRRLRGRAVPTGQPGDKAAVLRGRRQSLPVIAGEYFSHQDRQRPAIHDDVMICQHKPVPIRRGADQGGSKCRPVGQITDCGTLLGAQLVDALVDIDVAGSQLDVPPPRRRIGGNELHRLVVPFVETGRQLGMTGDHRLQCIAQPVRVERTCHGDSELHRIHVVACLRGAGMKEQPLLQGRQRQYVSDPHIGAAIRRSVAG
ncbi:hypothetical protein MFM001_45950 [Mycobacterium sp. MFM001]|nr:hypothetical protein MFM001_45950 [Mycobacterium sp. MFM001]